MLERTVKTVTGLLQFVTSVLGALPVVLTLTSGFPELDNVSTFEPTELAERLFTTTGTGKVIVPTGPLLAT